PTGTDTRRLSSRARNVLRRDCRNAFGRRYDSQGGRRTVKMIGRREFLVTGAAAATAGIGETAKAARAPAALGQESAKLFLPADDLKASTADRMPLDWHKGRAQKLRDKLAEDSYEGILLTDRWNIIYFTGLWHTTTERPVNVFLPVKGEPV